jgi:hypothetical protein
MLGSTAVIDYGHTFTFPVPAPQLWARIAQLDRFASWWTWLHDYSVEGTGLEHGTVLHGTVAPPLPYRMRLDVVLDECVPEERILASVHGDLEGSAQLTFVGDGAQTQARAAWTIEMMQRPMRIAAKIGHPLLQWGHDHVVDATVVEFRRQLVGELSASEHSRNDERQREGNHRPRQ